MSIRYEVYDRTTNQREGDIPHVHIGRCLDRVRWLNLIAQALKYSLRPVYWREST